MLLNPHMGRFREFNAALNKHGCLMIFSSSEPDASQFILEITNLITPED